jgi:large subunit ribosomal protein L17
MRHRKHNHLLGVKTAHRTSLVANLSCSLIDNGRITTTLAKARALRPSIEKAITLAKKAHVSDDAAKKVHYRRLAIARLRSQKSVKKLFDELVEQFVGRNGGYTRIYKLAIPRLGDAADMAIIEFVEEIQKKKAKKKRTTKKSKAKPEDSSELKEDLAVEEKSSDTIIDSVGQSVADEKIDTSSEKEGIIEEVSSTESEPKKEKKNTSKTKVEDKESE